MGMINGDCCALGSGQFWYIGHSFSFLDNLESLVFSLVCMVMEPSGWKPRSPIVKPSQATKNAIEVASFYEDFIAEEDTTKMHELEAEVLLTREFKED
jgi:hypothetical protein